MDQPRMDLATAQEKYLRPYQRELDREGTNRRNGGSIDGWIDLLSLPPEKQIELAEGMRVDIVEEGEQPPT